MKKKLLSLLLVTSLAAGMIAGCGAGGSSDSDNKSANGEDENTLTVWAWDQTFNIYAMKEAEKVYQKDHPDFKIILGNEIYLIKKEEYKLPETKFWHFILLAKDLKGYMQIRELRKRIARILTVLKEREAK